MIPLPVIDCIRASHISDWQKCPRIYAWKDLLGLLPKHPVTSAALLIGSLYHARRSELLAKSSGETARVQKEITEHLTKLPEDRRATAMRDLDRAAKMGSAMAEVASELLPLGDNYEVLAVELECQTALVLMTPRGPAPVMFGGRLDYLFRDKTDGSVVIDDEKTTKDPPSLRAAICPFEPQTGLYPLLVMEHRPKAMIHTIIQKPTIRFCDKDKTFDDFVKRVRQVYKDKDQDSTNVRMVGRSTTFLDPDHKTLPPHLTADIRNILNFLNSCGVLDIVLAGHECPAPSGETILSHIQQLPIHTHQCVQYGKLCTFHSLCHSSPKLWPQTIDSNFSQAQKIDPDPAD